MTKASNARAVRKMRRDYDLKFELTELVREHSSDPKVLKVLDDFLRMPEKDHRFSLSSDRKMIIDRQTGQRITLEDAYQMMFGQRH
jgi:hypothetical protein